MAVSTLLLSSGEGVVLAYQTPTGVYFEELTSSLAPLVTLGLNVVVTLNPAGPGAGGGR